MRLDDIRDRIPASLYDALSTEIVDLRPAQEKAISAGLLDGTSLLVCTPTASGKTLIAELCALKGILEGVGKAVYIVPLKALATEKHKEFIARYGQLIRIALSIGDLDRQDHRLEGADLIITTSEKLDSLIRHHTPWLVRVKTIIVDEIHLLNDPGRGPTLEVLLTILRRVLHQPQLLGLSATIGNPDELAAWLGATLVSDDWRPVTLKEGVYLDGTIDF